MDLEGVISFSPGRMLQEDSYFPLSGCELGDRWIANGEEIGHRLFRHRPNPRYARRGNDVYPQGQRGD